MALNLALGTILGEIGSGLFGAAGNIYGANSSAAVARENTQKQLGWERERATNAHQWEREDLIKAGINPILTAGGSGATTGGITPQMPDTSGYGKAGEALGQIFNQIITAQNMQANTAKAHAETQNINEQTGLIKIQGISERLKHGLIKADTALKEVEKILKNLDIQHYEENFANRISYNLPGIKKALNEWIEQTLADYGIKKEKFYNFGRNWQKGNRGFEETWNKLKDYRNWKKDW